MSRNQSKSNLNELMPVSIEELMKGTMSGDSSLFCPVAATENDLLEAEARITGISGVASNYLRMVMFNAVKRTDQSLLNHILWMRSNDVPEDWESDYREEQAIYEREMQLRGYSDPFEYDGPLDERLITMVLQKYY